MVTNKEMIVDVASELLLNHETWEATQIHLALLNRNFPFEVTMKRVCGLMPKIRARAGKKRERLQSRMGPESCIKVLAALTMLEDYLGGTEDEFTTSAIHNTVCYLASIGHPGIDRDLALEYMTNGLRSWRKVRTKWGTVGWLETRTVLWKHVHNVWLSSRGERPRRGRTNLYAMPMDDVHRLDLGFNGDITEIFKVLKARNHRWDMRAEYFQDGGKGFSRIERYRTKRRIVSLSRLPAPLKAAIYGAVQTYRASGHCILTGFQGLSKPAFKRLGDILHRLGWADYKFMRHPETGERGYSLVFHEEKIQTLASRKDLDEVFGGCYVEMAVFLRDNFGAENMREVRSKGEERSFMSLLRSKLGWKRKVPAAF